MNDNSGYASSPWPYSFHYVWFSPWYVEDAAISFAFAQAAREKGLWAIPVGNALKDFQIPHGVLLAAGERFGLSSWYMANSGVVYLTLGYLCHAMV